MLPKPSVTLRLRAALVGLALVFGLVVANPAPAQAAPKAPSGLTRASYSNNAVRLTWKAVKGAASYQVQYASNSKLKKASYLTVAAPVAEIGGLKASKNYYFKVQALKADGKALTKYSKTKKIKTRSKKSYSALSPAGVKATGNFGDEVTITWGAQGTTNLYRLRWATKKSMKGAKSVYVTGTSRIAEGLKRGTPYYFDVTVVSAKKKAISQPTSVLKVTTAKKISFGTPSGVGISRVNPTDFTVSWSAVRKSPAYRIAYASDSWDNPTYVSTAATSIKLDGLIANTRYQIKVQAQDAAGQPAGEFSGIASATTPAQKAGLRVASYNVRCHNCEPYNEEQSWRVRRDYVADTILGSDADLVSLQEAQQSKLLDDPSVVQFEDLRNVLNAKTDGGPWEITDTDRYNCKNPNSNSCTPDASLDETLQGASNGTRIAYRKDRLVLKSNGSKQLTPLYPAGTVDATGKDISSYERFVVWAVFQQRSTGKKFLFANIHLEPANDSNTATEYTYSLNRQRQARDVLDKLGRLNTENLPIVLAGDAASSRAELGGNLPYLVFTNEGRLVDPLGNEDTKTPTKATVETRVLTPFGTYSTSYNSVNKFERIARKSGGINGAYNDYIFVSPEVRVSEWETVVKLDSGGINFDGVIPSDHNLIRASLWLP